MAADSLAPAELIQCVVSAYPHLAVPVGGVEAFDRRDLAGEQLGALANETNGQTGPDLGEFQLGQHAQFVPKPQLALERTREPASYMNRYEQACRQ